MVILGNWIYISCRFSDRLFDFPTVVFCIVVINGCNNVKKVIYVKTQLDPFNR